jgi:Response regulators consisting of a CheY-like receiver domain and a winged-helix DNA-binding domain
MSEQKKKILLLEDYPDLIPFYRKRLTEAGFDVEVENDEVAGMKAALKNKPSLIIFDISLPENEDFGFIREIKKNAITKAIPVAVLTDLSAPEDVKAGLAAGASEYFVRDDFTFTEVIDRIKEIIKS